MVTRPVDQRTISDRFDFGLGYLLFLLLAKLIIAVKGVSLPATHSTLKPMIAYMILGLFSMGLVRARISSQTGRIIYLKGVGIILTFGSIALLLGGGMLILFLPELRTLAETSADLLKTTAAPLKPALITLLRFLLFRGCRGDHWQDAGTDAPSITGESAKESGILELISAVW